MPRLSQMNAVNPYGVPPAGTGMHERQRCDGEAVVDAGSDANATMKGGVTHSLVDIASRRIERIDESRRKCAASQIDRFVPGEARFSKSFFDPTARNRPPKWRPP